MEVTPALLPHLMGQRLEAVVVRGVGVRIDAATQTVRAGCNACGTWSTTVHSRYVQRLADVKLGGHGVLVALTVGRFTCANAGCPRQTFVEQVPGLTRRHARHTVLAAGDLEAVAVALGGRPGSRLAQRLAVSRMTLIRMIRRCRSVVGDADGAGRGRLRPPSWPPLRDPHLFFLNLLIERTSEGALRGR
ncbi:hypothetical protein [Micromonospora sp. NPDC005305]|uniref:hypothetical protein n=1 Tax=Micromonospora sp. NPDC005305 TaxID=3156875 RepID=UPI0033B3F13D